MCSVTSALLVTEEYVADHRSNVVNATRPLPLLPYTDGRPVYVLYRTSVNHMNRIKYTLLG